MSQNASRQITQRLWSYCDVLRDDGLSYGDYVEQLTFLLFLKMDDERRTMLGDAYISPIPDKYSWGVLRNLDGDPIETQYRHTLEELGKQPGMVGLIFKKAQNKIQDPAKLKRLVSDLIDREKWSSLSADVKGDAYEGLLDKNAQDVKGGAGQYFTPRPLINKIVEVMRPTKRDTICDPACGTGGFLISAYQYISEHEGATMNQAEKETLREKALRGWEIVDGAARLCMMNLILHGIEPHSTPITVEDALSKNPSELFSMVLTNPPFGRKSSVSIVGDDGESKREVLEYQREGFTATGNKQLNFVQHVRSLLKVGGRAAVVVPDNVLFEGGAGEKIRTRLLKECDVHTLLRLPTGLFYAQGVKANVLFFDRMAPREKPWTDTLWIYDLRTNKNYTLKSNALREEDIEDFVSCYNPDNRRERSEETSSDGRWKSYSYEELLQRDKTSLDIFWLRDASLESNSQLPPPEIIARQIADDLQAALEQFAAIASDLETRAAANSEVR